MAEKVGGFWTKRIKAKAEFLRKDPESIKDFKRNVLCEGIFNSFPLHTTEFLHYIEDRCFPEGIPTHMWRLVSSSTKGGPNTLRFYNTQTTAADIEYVYMASQLEKEFRVVSRVIVEIGAGYGGLCDKLIRATKRIKKYTLIDFAPHAKLQQYFLGERKELEYYPVNTFPQEPFDLAINTRSMMEMDWDEIEFYIKQIQKWLKPGGLFYLITKDKVTKFKTYPLDKQWKVEKAIQFPIPNRLPMTEYFLRRLG
jgi:SAM-dependent methyltransferase